MHQDGRVAEPVPAQTHPFAPVCSTFILRVYIQLNLFLQEVQGIHDDYGAPLPAVNPPEASPGVRAHHPAPPANMMPPAANGLRNLVGRFLNNPGTLVNMLRIEPGPNGRFEVWIALEFADIFE